MKIVLVDHRIENIEKISLEKLGYKVLSVPPSKTLYEAVCGHPDMLMHIVDDNSIIVHKDMDFSFTNALKEAGIHIRHSRSSLQSSYPYDIILNAVNLKDIFIHNIKYTDAVLLEQVNNKKLKAVKQGYTKCSTAIVSNKALMTSDKGIAKCAQEERLEVLLLPPGDILLPGLDYGFIGGCCGLLEDGLMAFYGDLTHYAYGNEVMNFLKKHKVEPIFLNSGKLIDRGSILTV